MGGFSVWHWLIVLCFLAVPAGLLALIVWLAVRGAGKPSTPPPDQQGRRGSGEGAEP